MKNFRKLKLDVIYLSIAQETQYGFYAYLSIKNKDVLSPRILFAVRSRHDCPIGKWRRGAELSRPRQLLREVLLANRESGKHGYT
jgi:hypothetical protein